MKLYLVSQPEYENPSIDAVLKAWERITDKDKQYAAQYLFIHGVPKKDIPEYRQVEWYMRYNEHRIYSCKCSEDFSEYKKYTSMPEGFVQTDLCADWETIKYIGTGPSKEKVCSQLCFSCQSVTLPAILRHIEQREVGVTVGGTTYIASETHVVNWHVHSRTWHQRFGPAITVRGRKVVAFDHKTLSTRVVRTFEKWPRGFPSKNGRSYAAKIQAIVDTIPINDVPTLFGTNKDVDEASMRRLAERPEPKRSEP